MGGMLAVPDLDPMLLPAAALFRPMQKFREIILAQNRNFVPFAQSLYSEYLSGFSGKDAI
jgi:hypothetical protein